MVGQGGKEVLVKPEEDVTKFTSESGYEFEVRIREYNAEMFKKFNNYDPADRYKK